MQGKEMLRKLLREFTARLGAPVSRTAAENLCWRDEYTLIDLQNILDAWKIQSLGIHIEAFDLPNVNCPALAVVKGVPGGFAILTEIQAETARLTYWTVDAGGKTVSFDDFSRIWHGQILLAEAGETSGDPEYALHKRQEKMGFWGKAFALATFVLLIGLGGYRLSASGEILAILLFMLKTAGLLLGLLLLRLQFFGEDSFTQKICGIAGKNSCKKVLASQTGKLFGVLPLSELVPVYFAGGFIALLLSGLANIPVAATLAAIALLALPAVPVSLYFQSRVIKQWCPLCLAVNVLLLAEGFCAYFILKGETGFNGIVLAAGAYLFSALLWAVFKMPLVSYAKQAFLETAIKRFKQDAPLFLARIEKQEPVTGCPEGLLLGSLDAPLRVTAVLSPDCLPCADAFIEMEKLLDIFEGTLSANIVLAAGHSEKHVSFRKHILGMAGRVGEEVLQKSLADWFQIMDYGLWAAKYPVHDTMDGLEALAEHRQFTRNISHTPAFFINGRLLPPPYQLADIKYFVRALAESPLLEMETAPQFV